MELVIFIPMLIAMYGLMQWDTQKTFLNVCLPTLILLPTYFQWRSRGGLDFGMAVLLPLGFALIKLAPQRWKLTRADLWIALFIFTCGFADYRATGMSLAKYNIIYVVLTALIPYMAGKLLVESGARLETAKRLVGVFCISCVLAIPESFLKFNINQRVWMHFFPSQWPGWVTQIRWGFGRVAGPCGSAELYGLVLTIAVLLLFWVKTREVDRYRFSLLHWSKSSKGTYVLFGLLLLTSFLTVSRGPWIGLLLSLLVASIGRTRHVRRTALIVVLLCAGAAVPAYKFAQDYTSGPRKNYGSDRETAQYRKQMLDNYVPLAKAGGLWGWGTLHPVLDNQPSIDNEFLLVFLVQGYVGVAAYILLFVEAAYALLRIGLSRQPGQDRYFCFTMLGILAGWALTLSTVYMGGQSYELFFMMVGWTQAIAPEQALQVEEETPTELVLGNRIYT